MTRRWDALLVLIGLLHTYCPERCLRQKANDDGRGREDCVDTQGRLESPGTRCRPCAEVCASTTGPPLPMPSCYMLQKPPGRSVQFGFWLPWCAFVSVEPNRLRPAACDAMSAHTSAQDSATTDYARRETLSQSLGRVRLVAWVRLRGAWIRSSACVLLRTALYIE